MPENSAHRYTGTTQLPLEGRELLYRSVFEGVPIGLYATTLDGRILAANRALADMLGFASPDDLIGAAAADLYVDSSERKRAQEILEQDGVVRNYDVRLLRRDGELIWARDNCRAVRGEEGTVLFFEGSLQDITTEHLIEARLAFLARHDPLTGVLNRHALDEIVHVELARARRYGHPMAVLLVDIDDLKAVNDEHGHAVGDRLLRIVASILQTSVREPDSVVRFGGDEFLVLLPETGDNVECVRRRILREIDEANVSDNDLPFTISVSIGGSKWVPASDEPIEAVLGRADAAMYLEKTRRRTPRGR